MRDIRVATVQFQHAPGDKSYNFGRVRDFVVEAARQNVEIIAFPEMCLTGYCSVSPRAMKPVDPAIWARRPRDPAAIRAELCGIKGRAWLMRWLPSRAK